MEMELIALFYLYVTCLNYFYQLIHAGKRTQHTFLLPFSPQKEPCEARWTERD